MSFVGSAARFVFDKLPLSIVSTFLFAMIIVVVIVGRRRMVERHVLGRCREKFPREVLTDALAGIAAGYIGSFLLFFLGITVNFEGFFYVLVIAFGLMLLDIRFLCFAYAAGLLSLVSLLFGRPILHVPGILALVAVLHIMESLLILVIGDRGALPVYFRRREETVGGYLLQRIWPIPLLGLTMLEGTGLSGGTSISTPAWWPLIPAKLINVPADSVTFAFMPLTAALGYGDISLVSTPRRKAVYSATSLGLYSMILLLLAMGAVRVPALSWLAALFAPCGHEFVLYLGRRAELRGQPVFAMGEDGVTILSVLPGSPAARLGLKPGGIITRVNHYAVRTKAEFAARLAESPIIRTITTILPGGSGERSHDLRGDPGQFGLILVPDPGEPAQVDIKPWHFLPVKKNAR